MDILLMGPPGAGKGTQGAILSDALGLPKFATGDLLRDAVKRGTPLGLQAKAAMEAGHLVSDEIIMGVVREELAKPEAAHGVIFDGVVRTIPQAEGLAAMLRERNRSIDHVLFFDVTDEEILGRSEGQRGEPFGVDLQDCQIGEGIGADDPGVEAALVVQRDADQARGLDHMVIRQHVAAFGVDDHA